MAEMVPLKMSCISASISFVLRSVRELIFGFAYATTVMFCVTLAVHPRLSVTVSTTATVPLFETTPTVSGSPVVLETETPLQVAV